MYLAWTILAAVFGCYALYRHGQHLLKLVHIWNRTKTGHPDHSLAPLVQDVVHFCREYSRFAPGIELQVEEVKDPFLKHALRSFLSGAVRGPELLRSLRLAAEEYQSRESHDYHELRKIHSFLPAMGWATALLGMVWFFQGEVTSGTYMATAGGIFSVVVGAVMYGLALTYGLIEPLVGKVRAEALWKRKKNQLVIESVSLLMKGKSPFEIYEHLSLLIPPEENLNFDEILPEVEKASA